MRLSLCLVLAACAKTAPPVHDAPIHDAAVDAPGAPTRLTVVISGSSAQFIHVGSQPAGIDCGLSATACTASFPRGSQVTLDGTTQPAGHCFTWMYSACAPGSSASCTLTLTADTTVTVNCASAVL